MAVISLLFLAVMYVVHHPLMVSDRMDLDTLARSRQLEKRMSEEMRQLEMEFEKRRRAAEQKQKVEYFWKGDISSDQLVLGKKDMRWPLQAEGQEGPLGWMLGNLWNAGLFCLFLIFELLRQNMQHEPAFDSSSDEEEEIRIMPVTSYNWLANFPSREALESFYKHYVQNATRDLPCTWVQREDTLVYLVSQASDQEQLTSVDWPESFAACEHLFLKLVGRFAPENTCHLKCLQIILSLRDLQSLPQGASRPILTSYHFKTALMHLLLRLPLAEWQHSMLSQRLQDILWFLGRGLQQRSLHHFLIGNAFLPLTIPIPKTFRNAEPVNLFQHLVLNPMAHSQALEEFHNLLTQMKTLPCAPSAGAH